MRSRFSLFRLLSLFVCTFLTFTAQPTWAQEGLNPRARAQQAMQSGDVDQALSIYRRFAYADQAWAQYDIGLLYLNGTGVDASPVIAVDWLRQAADAGFSQASYSLASLFCQTNSASGVVPGKCRENLQAAADGKVVGAMVDLARVHLRGQLGLGDIWLAKQLLEQAIAGGATNADDLLKEAEEQIQRFEEKVILLDRENIRGRFVKSTHTIELGSFRSLKSLFQWVSDRNLDRIYAYQVNGVYFASHNYFRGESAATSEMTKLNRKLQLDSIKVKQWKAIEASLTRQ